MLQWFDVPVTFWPFLSCRLRLLNVCIVRITYSCVFARWPVEVALSPALAPSLAYKIFSKNVKGGAVVGAERGSAVRAFRHVAE